MTDERMGNFDMMQMQVKKRYPRHTKKRNVNGHTADRERQRLKSDQRHGKATQTRLVNVDP